MNKILNLSEFNDVDRTLMEQRKIEFNKIRSKISSKSRNDSKPSNCLYCNNETTKFCNSHSVPAFFLRNIAVNGKVYTTNKIMNLPLLGTEKGIKETGTFKVICQSCDSKVFKEYETPDNYIKKPNVKMIAQMAMKNHLRNIGKRRYEISLYQNMIEEYSKNPFMAVYLEGMINMSHLDLHEYMSGFRTAKKSVERGWTDQYYCFFYEKLDYVVLIAFQGEISLHYGFEGNLINDVYHPSKKYKIQSVHISIFPLDTYSIVTMFIDKKSTRYRSFYNQFKNLSTEEKLELVNFIIFSYSEDVFMNKAIHEISINDENLKQITGLTSVQFTGNTTNDEDPIKREYNLSRANTIPNFLLMGV